jgi:hypothetical protein
MRYLIRPLHLLRALLLTAVAAGLPAHGADWRESGSDAEKLSKLVELVPNTATGPRSNRRARCCRASA